MSGVEQPWDFAKAVAKCRAASRAQEGTEEAIREAYVDAARKEQAYREALAVKILSSHAEGTAWSTCADIARGDKHVAALRFERDVAEGVKEAIVQAAWRRTADRKDAQRFADWSQRREFAEAYGTAEVPDGPILGARR